MLRGSGGFPCDCSSPENTYPAIKLASVFKSGDGSGGDQVLRFIEGDPERRESEGIASFGQREAICQTTDSVNYGMGI